MENRFKKRFLESVKRHRKRLAKGKPAHTTMLQSLEDNKRRFEMVKFLEHVLLGYQLDFKMIDQLD